MTQSPDVGDNHRLKDVILDASLAPSSSPDIAIPQSSSESQEGGSSTDSIRRVEM